MTVHFPFTRKRSRPASARGHLIQALAPVGLGMVFICGSMGLRAGEPASGPPSPPPVEPAPSSLWQVSVTPYGWLSGLDTDLQVKGYSARANVDFGEILDHLDMVGMLNVEARRGRWGFWLDGIYLELSMNAETPGPLLNSLGIELENVLAESSLFYRLWEGERGSIDLYAGARYVRMATDLSFSVDDAGVREASETLSREVFDAVENELRSRAGQAADAARTRMSQRARAALRHALESRKPGRPAALEQLGKINDADSRVERSMIPDTHVRQAIDAVVTELAALRQSDFADVRNGAAPAAAAARASVGQARSRAQAALTRAEKRLARAIERSLRQSLSSDLSASSDWIDPFIGLRARYQFTDSFYFTAKSDVGGFGVGSELTWQAYAGLGWQLNQNLASEIGYRYMDIDYESGGGAQFNGVMSGLVLSAILRF